jgi:hypothetical protein
VEVVFMGSTEDRVVKVIWRALNRHVKADHKLEVRRIIDGGDLEIYCCWCGNTVIAGSPQFVRFIANEVKESGANIINAASSLVEAV